MTAAEAARFLRVKVGRVRQLCAQGRVVGARHVRRGYRWEWWVPDPPVVRPGTRGPKRKEVTP